ncbi:MAG: Uma2 family endonuclease [Bacteroidota bacterium]
MAIPLSSRFVKMSDEDFFLFCQEMRDYHIERKADGTILIMEPSGSESGHFDLIVGSELNNWTRERKNGVAFGSSTGFTLPNKAVRSPDASWIAIEKWKALPKEDRKRFAHISPDFVIEVRSETDSLSSLQEKMKEYIGNGVRLAWLIDPQRETVWIYRKDGSVDEVTSFDQVLSGEDVLEGFALTLSEFWPLEDL